MSGLAGPVRAGESGLVACRIPAAAWPRWRRVTAGIPLPPQHFAFMARRTTRPWILCSLKLQRSWGCLVAGISSPGRCGASRIGPDDRRAESSCWMHTRDAHTGAREPSNETKQHIQPHGCMQGQRRRRGAPGQLRVRTVRGMPALVPVIASCALVEPAVLRGVRVRRHACAQAPVARPALRALELNGRDWSRHPRAEGGRAAGPGAIGGCHAGRVRRRVGWIATRSNDVLDRWRVCSPIPASF